MVKRNRNNTNNNSKNNNSNVIEKTKRPKKLSLISKMTHNNLEKRVKEFVQMYEEQKKLEKALGGVSMGAKSKKAKKSPGGSRSKSPKRIRK